MLGFQRVEVAQDAFERVFDVEHGFAVVAVAVPASCVSPFDMLRASVFCVSVGVLGVCGSCDFLLVMRYFGYSVCKYMPSAPPSPRGRGGIVFSTYKSVSRAEDGREAK